MNKQQDKVKIVSEISQAAKIYKDKLVGKQFMYVFDNRCIEVLYKTSNFKHLTGVDSNLRAIQFYQYAERGILTSHQIKFNSKNPYQLAVRKISHICDLATLAGSEGFILEDITTETQSYKFGTTDLDFTLCFDHDKTKNGEIIETNYVPFSLRDEDCFSKSSSVYDVTHIFRKQNDTKEYTDILYHDPAFPVADLPKEIKALLSEELICI